MTTMNHLLDGAPSACEIDWDLICWDKVEKTSTTASGAYCKGCSGRASWQSESIAVDPFSLVLSKTHCG
jgi:hypothetical protein